MYFGGHNPIPRRGAERKSAEPNLKTGNDARIRVKFDAGTRGARYASVSTIVAVERQIVVVGARIEFGRIAGELRFRLWSSARVTARCGLSSTNVVPMIIVPVVRQRHNQSDIVGFGLQRKVAVGQGG
jgi:nucleotidyltransferase/DNA polymerase involved in DNA repair